MNAPAVVTVCPHCIARWGLPAERIGPGGARVRCPQCDGVFDWIPARPARAVEPEGGDRTEAAALASSDAETPADGAAALDAAIAWNPATWFDTAGGAPETPEPASAVDELDARDATPALVARLAVEEFVAAGGGALAEANDGGRLFACFGPELLEAWSRCRARLGSDADPAEFRAALAARLGIDLPEWQDRG